MAGSIPILRNLDLYYNQNKNQEIRAILNGSSNYILTQMFDNDLPYQKALLKAQEKGLAESDPLADVGGFDAKHKAVILAAHAFGLVTHPDDVVNFGIQNITSQDVDYAKNLNSTIKQVVNITKANKSISIIIMPELVPLSGELAQTENEDNLIILTNNDTKFYFKGLGAGGKATGNAILSDLNACATNYRYNFKIDEKLILDKANLVKVRVNKEDVVEFSNVVELDNDHCVIECQYFELQNNTKASAFILSV